MRKVKLKHYPVSPQWLTSRNMPVEMFRVLILPQICNHSTRSLFLHDAGSNLPNHIKQLKQQLVILFTEGE